MGQQMYLRIALPMPLPRLFDYLPHPGADLTQLSPGIRIKVPFHTRELVGVLIDIVPETDVHLGKIKPIKEIIDTEPVFSAEMFGLCRWIANYYHDSLGEVLSAALPALLRKGKPPVVKPMKFTIGLNEEVIPEANEEQQYAIAKINAAMGFNVFLLEGVTGSGKTEVYLQVIKQCLAREQQILILVPEISLTPQTIARFQNRFQVPMVALHSHLTETARLKSWMAARHGEAKIVIGTRSAIFTPFANLGLIVVDEEHDASFKQQDHVRYHARDVAVMRAKLLNIPIILGSATPSLESLLNVKRKRYDHIFLPKRAGNAFLPQLKIVDLHLSSVIAGISQELLDRMQTHLEQNNQVMLFLNRRGFAPVLYCAQCYAMIECKRCDAKMVYHRIPLRLQCHHCDAKTKVPTFCPQCNLKSLRPVGLGTQKLEQELTTIFPNIPIVRLDRDSTKRKGTLQKCLEAMQLKQPVILLGTQMLAKGHHFPYVTLVGVIDADNGLYSADFRAEEHLGQLLTQVSGRAGRAEKSGEVIIQTRHPDHPVLQTLISCGYSTFSDILLTQRELANLPPFSHFAVLRAQAYDSKRAEIFLSTIKEQTIPKEEIIKVLGPVPALMTKRKGLHCFQLLIKSSERQKLHDFLKTMLATLNSLTQSSAVKWSLDVDPVEV